MIPETELKKIAETALDKTRDGILEWKLIGPEEYAVFFEHSSLVIKNVLRSGFGGEGKSKQVVLSAHNQRGEKVGELAELQVVKDLFVAAGEKSHHVDETVSDIWAGLELSGAPAG